MGERSAENSVDSPVMRPSQPRLPGPTAGDGSPPPYSGSRRAAEPWRAWQMTRKTR